MSAQPSEGVIGDLKYSILEPSEFRVYNGEGWVLLDGGEDLNRTYDKSWRETALYQICALDSFPDARGTFLRALNLGKNAVKGDPEGMSRKLGSYQSDSFMSHVHSQNSQTVLGAGSGGFDAHTNGGTLTRGGSTQSTGGLETRPKNISFYLYIKVD
ncbi:MAG: hypothetical protein NXI20_25005 [bacterium]|nr:hypothetical protein [bacterium]